MTGTRSSPDGDRREPSDDPDLSPRANALLREELREAAGHEVDPYATRDPVAHHHGTRSSRMLAESSPLRFLAAVMIALGLVGVALLVLLLGGTWWALVPLAVMIAVLIGFMAWVLRSTTDVEAASPEHRAALQEEGVVDPDHELNVRLRRLGGVRR